MKIGNKSGMSTIISIAAILFIIINDNGCHARTLSGDGHYEISIDSKNINFHFSDGIYPELSEEDMLNATMDGAPGDFNNTLNTTVVLLRDYLAELEEKVLLRRVEDLEAIAMQHEMPWDDLANIPNCPSLALSSVEDVKDIERFRTEGGKLYTLLKTIEAGKLYKKNKKKDFKDLINLFYYDGKFIVAHKLTRQEQRACRRQRRRHLYGLEHALLKYMRRLLRHLKRQEWHL